MIERFRLIKAKSSLGAADIHIVRMTYISVSFSDFLNQESCSSAQESQAAKWNINPQLLSTAKSNRWTMVFDKNVFINQ